ncbi:MAG: AAA family ATPase [Methylobacterium radiotolerans]
MTLVMIRRIVSERDFGVILATHVVDDHGVPGAALRVRALRRVLAGAPAVGETWRVEGAVADTPWGPQMDATRAVRDLPSGTLVRDFLAAHVPGIGRERADRLWTAYGMDLPAVLLAGDLVEIGRVIAPDRPLLGPQVAALTVRAWREADAEARLFAWLQARGVNDVRVARRVAAVLGAEAVATLDRNPWCLVPLLPWAKVDALGCRLLREAGRSGVEDAPDRLVGAVDAAMRDVIAGGDTMVAAADLRSRVADRLGVPGGHARVEEALAVGARNGAVVAWDASTWRAPGCALMEEAVIVRLRAMLEGRGASSGMPEGVERNTRLQTGTDALHPEQRAAVEKVLALPFGCLRGGAGVGKTHVTRAVCQAWEASGGNVVLAALAGKAALRLSRATGRLARTLARLIRELDDRARIAGSLAEVDGPERLGREARLLQLAEITPRSLVIVDEASMVDIATMHALLRRMPDGARLLLVGDERQLPPVGFGLVFHRLVADEGITASLTVVHRQSNASGIPAVAAAVRERRMPTLRPYTGLEDGVSLLPAGDSTAIEDGVLRAYGDLVGEDVLVVAPTRAGRAGVRALNEGLHALHLAATGASEMTSPLGDRFCVGEPVVHERNDYERGLWNGSMGRVEALQADDLVAEFDGEHHRFTRDALLDVALGYALTCHRAQGSQAGRVIIALTLSRLLDPSWLYTAITRAERQVVLVGQEKTIEALLRQSWAAERRLVGLQWTNSVPNGAGEAVLENREPSQDCFVEA